jgi:hypothetical protein
MKRFSSLWLAGFLLVSVPVSVSAYIPAIYTNENFFTSQHDAPVSFVQDNLGNFSGVTQTGKTFTQRAVVSDLHVRLHRFSIDEAFFYVSSVGIIVAESDAVALSIYLTRSGYDEAVG